MDDFNSFRMGHLARTAEVWKKLVKENIHKEKLNFTFYFRSSKKKGIESLCSELKDYPIRVKSSGIFKKKIVVSGDSGRITWDEEQLIKWVDYLISVGQENQCEFTGCETNY